MKKILIPIILSVLVAVSSCGPKRYLTTSRAPGVALERINIGAYNNDPGADKARTAFGKADLGIAELNRLRTYDLEEDELAILMGATITTAELNRLAGVTSAIQTQINNRIRTVDSTGNAAGNYVTRKALRDTVAVRDAEIALKANSDSPIFTTTATLPASLTIGSSSVTGTEAYSAENYGATGMGDVVFSIGATMTSPNITNAPVATGTVVAGTGITAAMLSRFMYFNTAAAIDITADPQIANGTSGQLITIIGSSDTNTLTLDDATGLRLTGQMVLGIGDNITLLYEGTIGDWIEISRSNN